MSLRTRLLIVLIASTSAIWICGFLWIYVNSQREIQQLLDRRLMEAARMVLSLSAPLTSSPDLALSKLTPDVEPGPSARIYEHRLSCQVWSFDGHLVGRSANAPTSLLSAQTIGFSEPVVDGETYRVYAAEDPVKGVRVLVGDNLGQRRGLVRDLLSGLLVPALIILPIIALLIWISVKRGLAPLRSAADSLSQRGADNLTPLDARASPPEIRPMIDALNALFEKVAAAREHERSVVAYAAHEMRTPLAGLKTQVQIAVKTTDSKMRTRALDQVLKGVDRTSRLVTQLLAMSRLDADTSRLADPWIDLEASLRDIALHIGPELAPERIAIETSICDRSIAMDRSLFDLATRNLVENALQHSPEAGTVRLYVIAHDEEVKLCIEDDGPGIPPAEEQLVLQRFFRGRHKTATGSGLGLAIVTAALDHAGAALRLARPESGRGLRAEIVIHANRFRLKLAVSSAA